ncbi:MAG: hypothetical protein O3B75_03905 [Planctomycetota bacterium]|nr:hypothetical protein [Planctomycetota bacterium]
MQKIVAPFTLIRRSVVIYLAVTQFVRAIHSAAMWHGIQLV